jgi:ATP-binding cassette, subfamily F, member 3
MHTLSGGQKRFVELVKVSIANADVILLDEPTNHLDYAGKAQFITWLHACTTAVCVISHDRDVLREVSRIIELRDLQLPAYSGNYDAYIKQNGDATVTQISQYESAQKRLAVLHKQIQTARARKGGASDNKAKILEERLLREYNELKANLDKPSFWIDKDTVSTLHHTVVDRYDRYKAKSIAITTGTPDKYHYQLLDLQSSSIGYDKPLITDVTLTIEHGERVQIRGRNGAGKSTLLQAIRSSAQGIQSPTLLSGTITASSKLRIGIYEQEIATEYLDYTLTSAVMAVYAKARVTIDGPTVRSILATYLFNPITDGELVIRQLSGGQKARFQLISMLCNNPNLLILDEPTNHLDLPSIEELESALQSFKGAILYVTHDTYFVEAIGGRTIQVGGL